MNQTRLNNNIRILFILILLIANIGCDQSTKYIARKHLNKAGTVQVLNNFFVLTYAENNGAFLSIFSSFPRAFRMVFLLVLPSIFFVIAIGYLIIRPEMPWQIQFAVCCITGGGIGNMIDRLMNNEYVIDFMNIGIGRLHTGIFNFADLSIMLGVAVFIIWQKKLIKSEN
jgi:signal peptidase II